MTIPMALVDYIPVVFFALSGVLMLRGLYRAMSKGAYALLAAGVLMIACAGFFKATWKLLYAANVCDFEKLNQVFFPMQSTGFVLAGLALVSLLVFRQTKVYSVAAAPAVFSGTMIFVAMMVLGAVGMCGSLAVIARRMKKPLAVALFIVAFVFMMGMGYLSSKDFADPNMNWIAEGVNIVGQGCMLLGMHTLTGAGLGRVEDVRRIAA
ncbi:MAG: hypothetical protein IJ438_00210 [Clostridia bacterium]|nr:hypothetical protein [Clostridia bacterium]